MSADKPLPVTTILFDLDGTLSDPFEGITRCIKYAMEKMGAEVPEASTLGWCIGPPLWDSFEVLLNTKDRTVTDKAVAFYRERYAEKGMFENTLIEGIDAAVEALHAKGKRMLVATSKTNSYAGKIVEHFGLMPPIERVYGAEPDGTRSDKTELIAHILQQEGLSPAECVMIGDRKFDLIGARNNSVRSIGVLWGYGSRDELSAEKPDFLAEGPGLIVDWVNQNS
ncbi:HAD family hydrolase [Roseibium sediminis]|uniref:HAD family hydrolase n=1 Tax=Roseibium sediminis TaxID=1775174 RepID=UPI00123CE4FB|nr:HAD family hydrolase [Roseibium sediminis]